MIPLIYLLIVTFRLNRRSLKWKFILMYAICLLECLLVVIHYGFLVSDSEINDVSLLTQEFIKFIAYFSLFSMLIYDVTRMIKSRIVIVVVVITNLLLLGISGLIIKEYIDISEYLCTSLIWIFIRSFHLLISICLLAMGIII